MYTEKNCQDSSILRLSSRIPLERSLCTQTNRSVPSCRKFFPTYSDESDSSIEFQSESSEPVFGSLWGHRKALSYNLADVGGIGKEKALTQI